MISGTTPRQAPLGTQTGAGLLFALLIATVLLISGAALASRILFGTYGSAYNQDTRRAREAAESGLTRIIAELNRERNRMLLAINPSANGFWSASEAASAQNPCAAIGTGGGTVSPPRLNTPSRSLIRSGGANASINADVPVIVYVADDGTLKAEADVQPDASRAENVRYAYQLITDPAQESIEVNPDPFPGVNPASGQLSGQAKMTIRVRGFSYNNGQLAAAVTVEQQFEILPKFCGLSLNGDPSCGDVFGNDTRPCPLPPPGSPPPTDFVSRAVRSYRLLPGS